MRLPILTAGFLSMVACLVTVASAHPTPLAKATLTLDASGSYLLEVVCDVPGHVGAGILGREWSGGLVGRAGPGVGLVGAGRGVGRADQRRARH